MPDKFLDKNNIKLVNGFYNDLNRWHVKCLTTGRERERERERERDHFLLICQDFFFNALRFLFSYFGLFHQHLHVFSVAVKFELPAGCDHDKDSITK